MDNVFPKEAMLSINGKEIGMVKADGRIVHKTANVGRTELDFSKIPQNIEFTAQYDPKIFEGVFHPAVDRTEIRARILREGK